MLFPQKKDCTFQGPKKEDGEGGTWDNDVLLFHSHFLFLEVCFKTKETVVSWNMLLGHCATEHGGHKVFVLVLRCLFAQTAAVLKCQDFSTLLHALTAVS